LAAVSALQLISAGAMASPASKAALEQVWRGEQEAGLAALERAAGEDKTDAETLQHRAEALAWTGKTEAALAALGVNKPKAKPSSAALGALAAELLVSVGRAPEGEALALWALEANPLDHRARLALGNALAAQGKRSEAHRAWDALADHYLEGRVKGASDLARVARGLWKTGYFKNANQVFQEASELEPSNMDVELGWGQLFLEKYNYRDADTSFKKVLEAFPAHLDALVAMATIDLLSDGDVRAARTRVERVLQINPNHQAGLRLASLVEVHDERWDAALERAKAAVALNPRDLESLSQLAAIHFLRDEHADFEATAKRALAIDPTYAAAYSKAGDLGERVHRYAEIVSLYERALEVDPEHAAAHVGLGIGYSRVGDDPKASQHLDRAYELDPYNVRAVNLASAFYDSAAKEYDFLELPPLIFRVHKREAEVLRTSVAPSLSQYFAELSKRYEFSPDGPVRVEIFPDVETFSVRTTGLPNLPAHGVCFGKVVTARSPSAGDFNWKQMLYHELAHVFHLQMSKARVPRWFTEGLAVHETRRLRPAWAQPMDQEVYFALQRGALPTVGDFNLAFTQAKSLPDILRAYYTASLLVAFIEERWGFPALRNMLLGWSERLPTDAVVKRAISLTPAELDLAFRSWLEARLASYRNTFDIDPALVGTREEAQARAQQNPDSARDQALLALALLSAEEGAAARQAVDKALSLDPKNPIALLAAAIEARAAQDAPRAEGHLRAVIDAGHESLQARTELAEGALAAKAFDEAERHAEAALKIEPYNAPALRVLVEVARASKDPDRERAVLERVLVHVQGEAGMALRLAELARQAKNTDLERQMAERAIEVAPFSADSQGAAGRVLAQQKQWTLARAYFERALSLEPERPATWHAELARALLALGDKPGALAATTKALSLEPDEPLALEVKGEID
jgi:tetratricopeptide (TPR) repeat protein